MAKRDGKASAGRRAAAKQAKAGIAHIDKRIDNARASLSIGRPSSDDIARTKALTAELEGKRAALAKSIEPSSRSKPTITPRRQTAIDAYKAAHGGREPKRSMSIKEMDRMVALKATYDARFDAIRGKPINPGTSKAGPVGAPTYEATPAGTSVKSREGMVLHADRGWITRSHADALNKPRQVGMMSPEAAKPSTSSRIFSSLPTAGQINAGMQAAAVVSAGARGYRQAKAEGKGTADAAVAGAKAAAVPAAIVAAPAIAKGAGAVSRGAFTAAGALIEGVGLTDWMLGMPLAKAAGVSLAVGGVAKGVELGAKVVGRVATPALAAYGAYQGAKEDQNTARGAARGALRSLDPTSIFMSRGIAERGFDAAFGRATPRMSGQQAAAFHAANQHYVDSHMSHAPADHGGYDVGAGRRGFGNPANQAAAQRSKGNKYAGPTG